MKMNDKNYKKFTDFYNFTVENANDNDVEFILNSIVSAAAAKRMELEGKSKEEINYSNPNLNKHNAKVVRDFFEDFLAKANDDEAIYLIECLKAIVKKIADNPEEVAKFVMYKKNEAAKEHAKKEN